MCELVGLRVTGLKRVRIGSVLLGSLPVGQWRYLRPDEHFGSPAQVAGHAFVPRAPGGPPRRAAPPAGGARSGKARR